MALDIEDKLYSPGQIAISVWDEATNAIRVTGGGGGGGDATAANQLTQIDIAQDTLDLLAASQTALEQVPTESVFIDYVVTPATIGTYLEVTAGVPDDVREIEIFDSSGQSLYLGMGAAASEVSQVIITPGGNGRIPVKVPASTRLAVLPITDDATEGYLVINFYK